MPVIRPVNYASVVQSLRLVNDAEPMAITFALGPFDGTADMQQKTLDVHAAFGNHLAPRISNQYSLVQTELLMQFDPQPAEPSVFLATPIIACTQENQALPQNTATLVHKRSGTGGARGRGRLYVPGVPEGEVSPTGLMNQTWVNFLQGSFTAWLNELANIVPGAATGMVILHQAGGVVPPSFPGPSLVTSLVIDPIVATQRRRLRK